MKLVELGLVASVSTGVVFRDQAPEPSPQGNVRALTIRDLVAHEPVSADQLPFIAVDHKYEHQGLQVGDVVLPSRGSHYQAWHFTGASAPVLPVGQINIIRAQPDRLSPGFLAWVLNSQETQARLRALLTGSNIQSLTKGRLLMLQIPLPTLANQRHIARAHDAAVRAAQIRHRQNQLEREMLAEMAHMLMNTGAAHA